MSVRTASAVCVVVIFAAWLQSCSGGGDGGGSGGGGTLSFVGGQAFVVSEDGTSAVQITLRRFGGSSGTATVVVTPTGITATGGTPPLAPPTDFDATPITVTFADGDAADKIVTIPILDDGVVEPDETLTLTLSSPSGANLGAFATAALTISNNDLAGSIEFASTAPIYGEDGSVATPIVVRRLGGVAGAVSVLLSTTDGTANSDPGSVIEPVDYAPLMTTVVFGDGDGADKTVVLTGVVQDALPENDETINFALSAATGGATIGEQRNAALIVVDDDTMLTLQAPTQSVNANVGTAVVALDGVVVVGRPGSPGNGDVIVFNGATGSFLGAISPPLGSSQRFGSALARMNDEVVVGAPGGSFPITHSYNPLSGALHLTYNAGAGATQLGAALAVDGPFLFDAAPTHPNGQGGSIGNGRVFQVNVASGVSTAFFTGIEPGDVDFGTAVVVADGVLFVSAPAFPGGNTEGRIFAFDIDTGTQLLLINNPFPLGGAAHMGASLTVFNGTIYAGAPDHDGGAANSGRVYLFDPVDGSHLTTIDPPPPTVGNGRFGRRVLAVRDRIVVQQAGGGPLGSGRLFIFDTAGALVQTIDHPNPTAGADFGAALAEFDGQLLVGAPLTDVSGVVDAGVAYVIKVN